MSIRHGAGADMGAGASVSRSAGSDLGRVRPRSVYRIECFSPEGELRWAQEFPNRVVNQGLNDLMGKYFAGSSYTAAHFVGLIDNTGFQSVPQTFTASDISTTTDTSTSPTGFIENVAYDEGFRQTLNLTTSTGTSFDNSSSKAAFTMNASDTIRGAFVITSSGKGAATGKLYGAATFSTGGRSVQSGDTLNVQITSSVSTG